MKNLASQRCGEILKEREKFIQAKVGKYYDIEIFLPVSVFWSYHFLAATKRGLQDLKLCNSQFPILNLLNYVFEYLV